MDPLMLQAAACVSLVSRYCISGASRDDELALYTKMKDDVCAIVVILFPGVNH